jgi:hypothetical protein
MKKFPSCFCEHFRDLIHLTTHPVPAVTLESISLVRLHRTTHALLTADKIPHLNAQHTHKMLLPRLNKMQAAFQRSHPSSKEPPKRSGHTLIRMFSSTLSSDLTQQHKLHTIDEIRLLTLPSHKIHKITKDVEDLGIEHHTARVVLIANNFDYDKTVTHLVIRVLNTLDYQERGLTALAIARLIEPADTLLEMDCVLSIMLRTSKRKAMWEVLGAVINEVLVEREDRRIRRLKARADLECGLQNMKGDDFNVEQD